MNRFIKIALILIVLGAFLALIGYALGGAKPIYVFGGEINIGF